jgi:Ca2+/Na+ antiporter
MWSTLISGVSSFVSSYVTYIKIGVAILVLCACLYIGYSYEHSKLVAYKGEVAQVAKAQEEKNKELDKQSQLITEGIRNEYEAKLTALRNYYSVGVRHTSSGTTTGISAAPKGTDAEAQYTVLAGQCAATTQQLVSLQEWINEQIGVK